jgi:hypothetical protein
MKAPQPQKARVEGVVLDASNGKLLSGAQVTLKPVQPSDAPRIRLVDPEAVRLATRKRTTGADGIFRFDDVEPGRYRIHVVCNGYARSEYGQRSDGQGTTLTFTSGQVISGLNVSLLAASIVTGRVCESSGKPAPGLLVSLLKVCFNSRGLRTLENSGTAITDDRGEYRIFWVSPGRYYLGVQSPTETTSRVLGHINVVERTGLPVTYHPGVLDWSNATVFDLPAATEVRATDLVLTETPTFSIKGTVVDKRTGQACRDASVSLQPRLPFPLTDTYRMSLLSAKTSADGHFEIAAVPPGKYLLRALVPAADEPLSAGDLAKVRKRSDLFGIWLDGGALTHMPIEVSSDVESLVVSLNSGATLPLRLSVEGQPFSSVEGISRVRVNLCPMNWRDGAQGTYPSQTDDITPEGTGTMSNVLPGEYRVLIQKPLPSPDLYIKQATLNGQDILDGSCQISGPVEGVLHVVFSNKAGRVEGTLVDQLQPVAGIVVVLIPDGSRHRDELFKSVESDQDGRFRFSGITPGGYRVLACEALEPFSYFDPEVLSRYEQYGTPVRVRESSTESVTVKIIGRAFCPTP